MSTAAATAPAPTRRPPLGAYVRQQSRSPNAVAYTAMLVGAIAFPFVAEFVTGGSANFRISQAADAGTFVLMAIGLNVVVGFAGLLDLGYAAFFAIGAYTYGFFASEQLIGTPIHHAVHLPFWIVIFISMFVAAGFGAILGAPTLRLRGDYLAIVTLGFGEIVPRVFKNSKTWTNGVNGLNALDPPTLPAWIVGPWVDQPVQVVHQVQITSANSTGFYVIMVILVVGSVILVNNLYRSRLGRAWMAVREDEVAAAAMGVNTVNVKLLAFGIGAAFSGFAGAFYGAKLSIVSPDNFGFDVSVTILIMVVIGGMGNIPGVMLGALLIYYVIFQVLPDLPHQVSTAATALGFDNLNKPIPNTDWVGLEQEVQRIKFLLFGLILIVTMLARPQGLLPSRIRQQELAHGVTGEDVLMGEQVPSEF